MRWHCFFISGGGDEGGSVELLKSSGLINAREHRYTLLKPRELALEKALTCARAYFLYLDTLLHAIIG